MPIASMTHNIGEFRSDADGFLSLPISTDSQRRRFYLTLNCGEKPRIPNPTKLSEILQENPDEKYRLSAKACQGILNRAERRGKELPPELEAALTAQATGLTSKEEKAERPLPSESPLLSPEIATERHTPFLSKSEQENQGGVKESSSVTSTPEHCRPKADKAYSIQGNTIDRDAVMAAGFSFGQSEKARSLGYEKEKSPTIRGGEGGNQKPVIPACDVYNQSIGGETAASVTAAVGGANTSGPKVLAVDCRNGTENPDVNGTLQAKDGGGVHPSI